MTYYEMVEDLTAFAKSYNPDFYVCYNKSIWSPMVHLQPFASMEKTSYSMAHLAEGLADAEHVMYDCGTWVEAKENAEYVQMAVRPVFNREKDTFCSPLECNTEYVKSAGSFPFAPSDL